MADANDLLFDKPFDDGPLFKNQLDLAQQLLATPRYFVRPDDNEEYNKALSRLKAYLSQLLSTSAIRTITEDFLNSLEVLLTKKIKNTQVRDITFNEIIADLRQRNIPGARTEFKQPIRSSIYADVAAGHYIVVISASPINTDPPYRKQNEFSIRQLFIEDLINNLSSKEASFKKYRFYFPLDTHCEIFWKIFERMLVVYLEDLIEDKNFIDTLYEKFAISTETHTLAATYQKISRVENKTKIETHNQEKWVLLSKFANNIIELLNRNKAVVTYHTTEPIFSIPVLGINVNQPGVGNLYYLALDDQNKINIIRTTRENLMLWTLFVWDKIRSSNNLKAVLCPALRKKEIDN